MPSMGIVSPGLARMCMALVAHGEVRGVILGDIHKRVVGRPVIDKILDGDAGSKLYHAARMVHVIVRKDQIIDLRDARLPGHSHNAVGIARAGPAGIHQQGLAGRGQDQRRLAAFDIDEIDFQSLVELGLGLGLGER